MPTTHTSLKSEELQTIQQEVELLQKRARLTQPEILRQDYFDALNQQIQVGPWLAITCRQGLSPNPEEYRVSVGARARSTGRVPATLRRQLSYWIQSLSRCELSVFQDHHNHGREDFQWFEPAPRSGWWFEDELIPAFWLLWKTVPIMTPDLLRAWHQICPETPEHRRQQLIVKNRGNSEDANNVNFFINAAASMFEHRIKDLIHQLAVARAHYERRIARYKTKLREIQCRGDDLQRQIDALKHDTAPCTPVN